ncbi:MAG: DUF512 domain-containing protein [Acidimicrobiia bacterium]
MSGARVLSVTPNSPAQRAGVAIGDEILTVNGEVLLDVIQYQIATDGEQLEIELRTGGMDRTVEIDKLLGEPLGIELANPVFDRIRTCDNHCPFCFIYQLPPGMRKSLSIKDDDFRLSFLYGNFTTLTRFTEMDLERVVTERLSPINVSIHATDPDVRSTLLRNRRGASSLRWLRAMLDADITVHGQVVVCPGINDGDVLEETLGTLFDIYPELATVGVVPLGVSAYNHEETMRAHTTAEAEAVLEIIERWQRVALAERGRRFVFASDEYYLMCDREFPDLAEYEGAPQYENGIGMAATLLAELDELEAIAIAPVEHRGGFFQSVDGAPHFQYRPAPTHADHRASNGALPIRILTGEYGAAVLNRRVEVLQQRAHVPVEIVAVANAYFGGTTAVTGLLTGKDVMLAMSGSDEPSRWIMPDVVLTNGKFLDDMQVSDLPAHVEVIPTSGTALLEALEQ